jgi:DNA-binding GntR family transcriptional regulator
MSEKIKHLSLAEKVYHRLLDKIVTGKLSEGSKLSEESICQDFGVSRTPAREALMMLCRDKLVERIPRCGCFTRKFDTDEITELFECRSMLECLALEQGFDELCRKELKALISVLKSSKNRKKSLNIDERLHELIVQSCTNKALREIIRQTIKQTKPLRAWRSAESFFPEKINQERIQIIQAILDNQKKLACELLSKHIMQGISEIKGKNSK